MPTEPERRPGELVFTEQEIDLIRKTKMPDGSTEEDVQLLIYYARQTGLNPLLNQVYPARRKGKTTPQATIDGFRLAAERTGQYLGQTVPMFCGDDGLWTDAWTGNKPPTLAKVGILRKGFKEPLYGIARYAGYVQRNLKGEIMDTWQKMPDVMLAKTAEALAFRKAFPNILSGIYTPEEMGHLDEDEQDDERTPDDQKPKPPQQITPATSASRPSATSTPQSATSKPTPASQPTPAPQRTAPTTAERGEGGITEDQVKRLWEAAQTLGFNVVALTNKCNEILGTNLATPRDLTPAQAEKAIAELVNLKAAASASESAAVPAGEQATKESPKAQAS